MDLRPSRLRRGEILAGCSAVVLLVATFALAWLRAGRTAANGWSGLPVLRWFLIVSALAGLGLTFLQATRRAPAFPVVMSVLVTAFAGLTTLLVIIRLLTWGGTLQPGAYVGVVAVATLGIGGFLSMRQEDGWQPGPGHQIERIALGPPEPPSVAAQPGTAARDPDRS